ncbi:hypothetical protein VNO78_22366 [Psophocarpus tetragonolobus]|uniref:Serine/threonine-protein kinase ATM n=1 Tax=Psophocarpus tetragonolobus TaxID=3891 RepID=A0AAN9XID4_PSOTE
MDLVLTLGREVTISGDDIKMSENTIMSEEASEKLGGGFDSRDRRKSKYLSYPYTNIGPKQKDLPAETEDVKTPCPSLKAGTSSVATNPLNGSTSYAKLGSKRFRKSWYRKFICCNTMSSKRKFINTSANEILSGLYSTAVDCMFPVGNKSFDLVEQFFCRYRVLSYHDEAELATSHVNAKEEKLEKPVSNDLQDTKSKNRNNNKMENSVRRKRKSLSGLLDVNANTSNGDPQRPGTKLKQKRKVEEMISVDQPQNVEINLIGGSNKYSSIPQASQDLSCLASEGKAVHKKREREKIEAQEHQSAQISSVYTDAKRPNCSSLVIDLQFTSPPIPVDIPERNKSENKEELVLIASNQESHAFQEGHVRSITDHRFSVHTKADVGTVPVNKTGLKNNMGKTTGVHLNIKPSVEVLINSLGKAARVHNNTKLAAEKTGLKNCIEKAVENSLNTKLAIEIPDLNGTDAECSSISTEFDTVNFISPELKSEQSRNLSARSRPTKATTYNGLDDNAESLETCLFLQFAPVAYIPSKEDLMTTFCRFGPLKASETQLLKDTGSAQVVFVRSADAAAAFQSLEQNKFVFGSTLVGYKLHHLSAACLPVKQLVIPAQPTGFMAMLGMTTTQPTRSMAIPGVNPTQPIGSMAMPDVIPTQPIDSMAMPSVILTQPIGSVAMPSVTPTQPSRSMAVLGVTPTQPTGSVAMPGETPPSLQFIKQNLQMMTSILENSGSSLSPHMRDKLDSEIKNLMRKVNSRTNV